MSSSLPPKCWYRDRRATEASSRMASTPTPTPWTAVSRWADAKRRSRGPGLAAVLTESHSTAALDNRSTIRSTVAVERPVDLSRRSHERSEWQGCSDLRRNERHRGPNSRTVRGGGCIGRHRRAPGAGRQGTGRQGPPPG